MVDAMAGTELPTAAPGKPSRSAEALPRADEARSMLPSKCRGGRSNLTSLGMPSKNRSKLTSQAS